MKNSLPVRERVRLLLLGARSVERSLAVITNELFSNSRSVMVPTMAMDNLILIQL
jgi:hypothetical protein